MTTNTGNPTDWLLRIWKSNPEGLLLLAAGGALLLRSGSSSSGGAMRSAGPNYSAAASDYTETARSHVNRAVDDASDYASDLADKAKQATSSYASSAADYTRKTTDALRDQSSRMMDQGTSAIDRIIREQPLVVALSGLAIGAAAAAAFAPTEMEKRTIGPVVEQATDQLKKATETAGNKLKEAAEERGLNAEGLKEVATEVGEAFTPGLGGGPDRQGSSSPETSPQPR
jgi:gas vesicle protein